MNTRVIQSIRALAVLLLATICVAGTGAAAEPSSLSTRKPALAEVSTVVFFFDGMRWDAINAELTPHLFRLRQGGVGGEMIPVWPTISSPNHWAMATGLYPEHSGVYANYWYSPADNSEKSRADPRNWRGEPIWAALANQGLVSGVVGDWIGVANIDQRRQPTYHLPSDRDCTNCANLAAQLLHQDPQHRPRFLEIYSPDPDEAQHEHGVGSSEALSSIRRLDQMVGQFIGSLQASGLNDSVNIIIVADHGQANVDQAKLIELGAIISQSDLLRPYGSGPSPNAFIWPKPGKVDELFARLEKVPHLRVWRAGTLPGRLHCCATDQAPPIVALADDGWSIVAKPGPGLIGVHGWDNEMREMHAAFIAAGPAFKRGARVLSFEAVDVHALLAHLTGAATGPSDGRIAPFCRVLKPTPATCRSVQ